jgi:nucleoside-diphosphate-sugar epimerase
MTKKLLLTGAAGFTGRHFITQANRLGYQCMALCHKEKDQLGVSIPSEVVDLADKEQLRATIEAWAPDYVVHLASVSFVAHGDSTDIYRSNLLGTINLLDCLIELAIPVKKVLLASSGNVYGNYYGLSDQLPITEAMQPFPVNDYGVSKYAMELAAELRFKQLPIIMVRPFNYTGLGQGQHFVIPKLVAAFKCRTSSLSLGNLDVSRDFSDVRDVVSAYLKLLESEACSATFNLCSGKATSLQTVIAYLGEQCGYHLDIQVNSAFVRDNEIKTLYGSNQKLVQLIGPYQQHQLNDTLDWMLEDKGDK